MNGELQITFTQLYPRLCKAGVLSVCTCSAYDVSPNLHDEQCACRLLWEATEAIRLLLLDQENKGQPWRHYADGCPAKTFFSKYLACGLSMHEKNAYCACSEENCAPYHFAKRK